MPAALRIQSHSTAAMLLKPRLAGIKNYGAILQHFILDTTLADLVFKIF
jgi:hypothetical protein